MTVKEHPNLWHYEGNWRAQQDWTLENKEGFQWRWTESDDRQLASFRISWGEPKKEGKDEFYVGWKMSKDAFRKGKVNFTFFQVRPAWIFWGPAVLLGVVIWLIA